MYLVTRASIRTNRRGACIGLAWPGSVQASNHILHSGVEEGVMLG
jgi:hypothetical protein